MPNTAKIPLQGVENTSVASAYYPRPPWVELYSTSGTRMGLRPVRLGGAPRGEKYPKIDGFARIHISGGSVMKKLILGTIVIALTALSLSGCGRAANPAPVYTPTGPPTASAVVPPGDSERTLTVAGMERSYLLHVPRGLGNDQPLPLVLIFHGYSGDGESIMLTTGFNEIADAYGFLVAYPNGTGPSGGSSWNAGGCCGYASQNNIDEPAFIHGILSDLGTIARIDSKRIYAVGFSNGAMLSYRLGCEMSDTFAAIAPVAGTLLTNTCRPQQPVSIIHIHGLNDISVPYTGGPNPAAAGAFPSVEWSIAIWAALDNCPLTHRAEQNGSVTHFVYTPCKNGTAVELYAIQGIGHIWPPASILPASQIIWNFFVAHPKP
jgi:polyhydroxybutyrate depolymerase